ncbi:hypothetical protein [Jeongeupia chitinilytica]|uniref:Uncharacterized protein n=1 Tax=Jeongeupia chitinilytica TaxID=1041641 RepID=A0ABQ3GZ56_9NEIS|nr:hypothetical protein [Jeongeupia chitinilytica]GHD60764.1 hypothetical protein GCM10007350_14300 [Jeongeupia chitinilytica]
MKMNVPTAQYKVSTQDLIFAITSLPPSTVADVCGVGIDQVQRWKVGADPLPFAVYQLLRFFGMRTVPSGFGAWSGWRFTEDTIIPPGGGRRDGARIQDVMFIRHWYIDRQLLERQSNLIDDLTRQLDFYKRQCTLEARYGLMLATLFGNGGHLAT